MDAISPVTFDRMVVPLDGSRLAEVVIEPVTRLARRLSARVILLHVLEDRAPATVHGDRHLTTADEADAYLAEIAQGMAAEGVDVEYHSHDNPEGDVAASISDHAAELGASLLVLCTHGRGRPRDWIVGSIAQQVVRKAETPVLLIRPSIEESWAFPPQRVITALDGTPEAERVLPVASAFARAFDVPHELLIAVPTLGTLTGDRIAAARLVPSATAASLDLEAEEAGAYARGLAEQLATSGVADAGACGPGRYRAVRARPCGGRRAGADRDGDARAKRPGWVLVGQRWPARRRPRAMPVAAGSRRRVTRSGARHGAVTTAWHHTNREHHAWTGFCVAAAGYTSVCRRPPASAVGGSFRWHAGSPMLKQRLAQHHLSAD